MSLFDLTNVYNVLSPYLTEFKTASFYEYLLDGDSIYISDGGSDMYDGRSNVTTIINDTTTSSELDYNQTTPTDITVTSSVKYVSLGYARPLIMLATSNTRGKWGFRKTGDLGSDGSTGSTGNRIDLYNGSIINGYTVYATAINWWVPNQADPAICEVYFSIGNASSVYHSTSQTIYNSPSNYSGNGYESYVTMDSEKTLFGCMLLSKQTVPNVSVPTSEIQTVITALVNRLRQTSTILFSQPKFYRKYLLNSTFTIPIGILSTNNTDTYTLTHSSGDDNIVTITNSGNVGTVTVKGIGSVTVTSTIAKTTNFNEKSVTLITIDIIGNGTRYNNLTLTSIDLSGIDLTGTIFSYCVLTGANLFGATVSPSTDLTTSTLTSLMSGRIVGTTSLLPVGYKII